MWFEQVQVDIDSFGRKLMELENMQEQARGWWEIMARRIRRPVLGGAWISGLEVRMFSVYTREHLEGLELGEERKVMGAVWAARRRMDQRPDRAQWFSQG